MCLPTMPHEFCSISSFLWGSISQLSTASYSHRSRHSRIYCQVGNVNVFFSCCLDFAPHGLHKYKSLIGSFSLNGANPWIDMIIDFIVLTFHAMIDYSMDKCIHLDLNHAAIFRIYVFSIWGTNIVAAHVRLRSLIDFPCWCETNFERGLKSFI